MLLWQMCRSPCGAPIFSCRGLPSSASRIASLKLMLHTCERVPQCYHAWMGADAHNEVPATLQKSSKGAWRLVQAPNHKYTRDTHHVRIGN